MSVAPRPSATALPARLSPPMSPSTGPTQHAAQAATPRPRGPATRFTSCLMLAR